MKDQLYLTLKKQGLHPEVARQIAEKICPPEPTPVSTEQPNIVAPPASEPAEHPKQTAAKKRRTTRRRKKEKQKKEDESILKAVKWVFENMNSDVREEDAPSKGAWAMLNWARSSPQAQTEFYRTFVPKLLPSRRELDLEREFSNVDQSLEAIDDVLRLLPGN